MDGIRERASKREIKREGKSEYYGAESSWSKIQLKIKIPSEEIVQTSIKHSKSIITYVGMAAFSKNCYKNIMFSIVFYLDIQFNSLKS